MKKFYHALRRLSAVLIGIVFFIAGTLKLMDPLGTGLISLEYFKFFHITPPEWLAIAFGDLMALVEAVAGAALITGVWRKIVGIVTGAMLLFFTVLTLILQIANPPMECGCFGEALHLTHLQSLVKNLILCGMWLLAFIPMKDFNEPKKIKYATFLLACVSSLAFGIVSLYRLPFMDFTPLKAGTILEEGNGLSIYDSNGEYRDSLLLSGQRLVTSFYDFPTEDELKAVIPGSMVITPGPTGAEGEDSLFFADRRSLMSLNRSNGGISYLDNGEIVRKWSVYDAPDNQELEKLKKADPSGASFDFTSKNMIYFEGYMLYVFAVMLLL